MDALLHGVDHLQRRGLDGEDNVGVGDQLLRSAMKATSLKAEAASLIASPAPVCIVQLRAELDQLGNIRWRQSQRAARLRAHPSSS